MPSPSSSDGLSRNTSPSPVLGTDVSFEDCMDDIEQDEERVMDCRSSDDIVIVSDAITSANDSMGSSPDDWLPLDLCYGVPLFDNDLCEWTCQKVRKLRGRPPEK